MSRSAVITVNGATTKPVTKKVVKPAPVRKPFVEDGHISSGDKHLEWIACGDMQISPRAQRKHDSASSRTKIEDIATNFDPDKFGTLTVNLRDGVFYIIDGGHRYLGVIRWFGDDWEVQKLQCWTYRGLS